MKENSSAKIIHLRVTIGADDPRSIDEFRDQTLAALKKAKAKNVTVLGMEHLHGGERYSVPSWEAFLEAGRHELRRMLNQEAIEAEAIAEKEDQDANS